MGGTLEAHAGNQRLVDARLAAGRRGAHRHRKELQTCIKRRQYAVLGGYVSRALREDQNLSVTCFAFVPLVIEAIWSQHAELSLRTLTEGLNLNEMTRRRVRRYWRG